MLILTRCPSETIHIGNNIVITIAQIKGGRVRVGISAPDEVKILRGEIADEAPKQRHNHPIAPLPAFQSPQVMGFSGAA